MDLNVAVPRLAFQTHVFTTFAGVFYDPDNSLCVKVDSDPFPVLLSGPEIFVLPWHVQHFSHERAKLNYVHCAMNVSLLFLCLLMSTEARTEWNTTLVFSDVFQLTEVFYEVR